MKKRYQVFVSSTFLDLQDERQEVMQALLELSCIPAGMELFPAANEDQWTLIKNVIDDCDYYLVIIGGRYGSLGPEGLSYTEMEYRYALERGKPTIAFVHHDPGMLPANRTESTPAGREKLEAFRALVQQKVVRFWKSPANLGSVLSRSLMHLILNVPATGWIRADQLPTKETSAENLAPDNVTRKGSPADSFKSDRTGNLYWLGHDLMWIVTTLLHEGTQASALDGLRQAHYHLCEIGMNEEYERQLARWLKEVETTNKDEWTLERRRRLASAVDRLSDQVGALAETYQKGFRASPED
jgi:uncharacterized protein DUF4062